MVAKHGSNRSTPPPKIGIPAVAVVSGSFLSGAMMSLSAFAVPVFLDTMHDPHHLVRQWSRLYHYGHVYLPGLCVATCGLYGLAALGKTRSQESLKSRRAGVRYALAAVLTIAMVPLTWIFMTPTNNVLFAIAAADAAAADRGHVRGLVTDWAWMHAARALTPLVGALLGLTTLLQEIRA